MWLFIAGLVIGGVISWGIAHWYYVKAGRDQQSQLGELSETLRSRNTLSDFEQYLDESAWEKTQIDRKEVWVCSSNNTFQIRIGDRIGDVSESWACAFPDRSASSYPVYLSVAGTIIKELSFVAMDGHRYFVPMTNLRPQANGEAGFFWNLNSLEVKTCRVVGDYHSFKNLEAVAEALGVDLVS